MRENIEELPLLIELANSLNVEEVTVAYMSVYFRELEDQSLYFYKELSDKIMLLSKEKGEVFWNKGSSSSFIQRERKE
jgi:hypothetical protein